MFTSDLRAQNEYQNQLINKWSPVLDEATLPKIDGQHKRAVVASMLENQLNYLQSNKKANMLLEETPTNAMGASSHASGNISTYDSVLISMIRRAAPQNIAFDTVGVQPMSGPSGLIFAIRARFRDQGNAEALFNEANTGFSAENAANTHNGNGQQTGTDAADINSTNYTAVSGMTTAQMEALGVEDGNADAEFNEMAATIEAVTVTARGRGLKAEYSLEMEQDMKAVHGLDAETELANFLTQEIVSDINREIIRKINISATLGATDTANTNFFDLDVDSNGRWGGEKFAMLYFRIEQEANQIATATRRGKGNMVICSQDVASALAMSGRLNFGDAANALEVDPAQNTFAGTLPGGIKVFVDPYFSSSANLNYLTVGYKGASPWDAGIFYCPYVPLQMMRAVGEESFAPRIGFKTRYGLIASPFATAAGDGAISFANKNIFYRRVGVKNVT